MTIVTVTLAIVGLTMTIVSLRMTIVTVTLAIVGLTMTIV